MHISILKLMVIFSSQYSSEFEQIKYGFREEENKNSKDKFIIRELLMNMTGITLCRPYCIWVSYSSSWSVMLLSISSSMQTIVF